jgi:hypothetical protein
MIFELRNKIPHDSSFLTSEDVLTSTIFGNLRYFSDQNILIHFLNEAIDINGDKLKIDDENIFEIHFWEKFYIKNNHQYDEPDLYLTNANYDIIIECKYFSILSEVSASNDNKIDYSNQIIRYSKIIEKSNRNKVIIYLTRDAIMPYKIISSTIRKLKRNIHLYWLSWRMLYKAMDKLRNQIYGHGEKQLFKDLFLFLKRRKLTVFCGLNIHDVILHWKYLKQYKYIPKNFITCNFWRYKNEK